MSSHFPITMGDTLPVLTSSLMDADGAAIDLTGATVTFRMRAMESATLKVNAAATVDAPATAGKVRYAWQVADTDTPGGFFAEWRITYAAGQLTVPNEAPIVVQNRARLEDLPAVDASVVLEIRARIGSASPPSDTDLMLSYETLGTVDKVVLGVLETRLSSLLSKPAKYTIEGDSSFDYSANLQALQREVAALRNETGSVGLSVGQLVKTWER